jgi:hypothetical protein
MKSNTSAAAAPMATALNTVTQSSSLGFKEVGLSMKSVSSLDSENKETVADATETQGSSSNEEHLEEHTATIRNQKHTDCSNAAPLSAEKHSADSNRSEFETKSSAIDGKLENKRYLIIANVSKKPNMKTLIYSAAAHGFSVAIVGLPNMSISDLHLAEEVIGSGDRDRDADSRSRECWRNNNDNNNDNEKKKKNSSSHVNAANNSKNNGKNDNNNRNNDDDNDNNNNIGDDNSSSSSSSSKNMTENHNEDSNSNSNDNSDNNNSNSNDNSNNTDDENNKNNFNNNINNNNDDDSNYNKNNIGKNNSNNSSINRDKEEERKSKLTVSPSKPLCNIIRFETLGELKIFLVEQEIKLFGIEIMDEGRMCTN